MCLLHPKKKRKTSESLPVLTLSPIPRLSWKYLMNFLLWLVPVVVSKHWLVQNHFKAMLWPVCPPVRGSPGQQESSSIHQQHSCQPSSSKLFISGSGAQGRNHTPCFPQISVCRGSSYRGNNFDFSLSQFDLEIVESK